MNARSQRRYKDNSSFDHVDGAFFDMVTFRDYKKAITIHRPDLREKLFFLLSGMIVSIPFTLYVGKLTKQLCFIMPLFYARVCSTAILTPFIEEFAKAYPLFYRHGETEKSLFTLGFIVGLGFGITEFLIYILQLEAPIYSRLPAIFFHAANTSITAYGIARNRIVWPYLIAVTLHSMMNLSAIFGLLWLISGFPILSVTLLLSWYLYQKTSEKFVE